MYMKVELNDNSVLELKEVYNSVMLKSNSGEELAICMRDSGFEFKYQGVWYSAKEGKVEQLNIK